MLVKENIIKNYSVQDSFPVGNLKERKRFSVQFRGVNSSDILSLKNNYKKLCSKEDFNKILDILDPSYKKYFQNIIADLRDSVKQNSNLFKDMPENIKTEIENGSIISRPQKGLLGQFTDAVVAPVTSVAKFFKNKFANKEKLIENKKIEEINTNLANIEGLFEYVNNLKEKDPSKVKKLVQEKIKSNFTKIKANYSSNLATTFSDLAGILVATAFNGCDFYNLTRRVDDNHKAGMREAKMKVKQDLIRVGLLTYLTYVFTTLFKKGCNRSMTRMLAVASVIQLVAEIATRVATGRPILPIKDKNIKIHQAKEEQKIQKNKKTNKAKNPSFTGVPAFLKKKVIVPKEELKNILNITEKINPELSKRYAGLIEKNSTPDLKGKTLTDAFADNSIGSISLGEKESVVAKVLRGIFIPVTAPFKLIKKLTNKEKNQVDEMLEVRNYLAYTKRLLKTKYKNKNVTNNKEDFNELKKDIMNASFGAFRSTEANYNTATYSIVKRIFAYSIFTTFMAFDAYNVTMLHSDGDRKKSSVQAKQRIVQEVTKFLVSIYTASANLTVFGELYNKSIGNLIGLTAMISAINNTLTRKILGIPIMPKNKAELDKIDEKNKKSPLLKFTNRLTGKDTEMA